ncbi:Soluble pyridine nucleotide transhydrogenase [Streptomyces hirsutus]
MDDSYDLVVIGAGPAGEVAAELAAVFGRKVLIVERNTPGGVVTTTGGAPTKALREAALYLTGYRQEEVYGVRAAAPLEAVMPTLRARIEHVRDVLQEAVAHRLVVRGIAYLQGTARLDADRTVHITSPDGLAREVTAHAVLIATGSRPTHYPGIPFDDPDVYDSDAIYSLRTVPKHIVIVGGGPIGVEFATVFTALGVPATLISNSDRLLAVDGGVTSTQGRVDLGEVAHCRGVGRRRAHGGAEPGTGGGKVPLAEPHQSARKSSSGDGERRDTPMAASAPR